MILFIFLWEYLDIIVSESRTHNHTFVTPTIALFYLLSSRLRSSHPSDALSAAPLRKQLSRTPVGRLIPLSRPRQAVTS